MWGAVAGCWRARCRGYFGYNREAETKAGQILADVKTSARPARLLVIGGGEVGSGVQAMYDDPQVQVIGTDIYHSPHTTLIADGHRLPFADQSVDGVWIQAVLEHVLDPQQVVAESTVCCGRTGWCSPTHRSCSRCMRAPTTSPVSV